MTSAPVDLEAAARFLAALTGEELPRVTFQTFDDRAAKSPSLARILHGTLAQHAATLTELSARGAGVFVTINQTDLQGRKTRNVLELRALFVDVDGPAPATWALEPDIVVASAAGPHAYWLLRPGEDLTKFAEAQKRLAAYYSADPKICDLPRVMRLPGFLHRKGEPRMVTLERVWSHLPPAEPFRRRTIAEILLAHVSPESPAPERPSRPSLAPAPRDAGELPALSERVFRASCYLEKIPGAVAGKGGHDQTWDTALCVVRHFALEPPIALELLLAEYNHRCSPPWSLEELRHKVEDAYTNGKTPWGLRLRDPRPTRRVPAAAAAAPTAAAPLEEGAAAPSTPTSRAEEAIRAGRPAEEVAPLLSFITEPIVRDRLIAQLAHDQRISKQSINASVRAAMSRRRGPMRLVPKTTAVERPDIHYDPGRAREILLQAEAALLAAPGPAIYQRSGQLVRVIRLQSLVVRGSLRRPQGALSIVPVDPPYLVVRLSEAAFWHKRDARSSSGYTEIDAPLELAVRYLSLAGEWQCPALVGLLEAPTLRPDGSLLEATGYDESTGLYYDAGETAFPSIPPEPTREDAKAALGVLLDLLRGFPFVAPSDRSAALSAILTALVRPCLRSAPLHLFRAPRPRSGKSLLADVVALLATGRSCAVMSQASDPEEERKRLLAILLAGDRVVSYDNVERELGSPALCQVLTQATISDRVLGASRVVSLPTAASFLATGNNLLISGDLTSRVVTCDLDSHTERPEERTFDVDLYEEIPKRRGELVVAALTILRAYHVAGRPAQPIPAWGGFEEYSGLVRSALVWVGEADPAGGRFRIEDADPVRSGLRRILSAWYEAVKDRPVTVAELLRYANLGVHSDLKDAFQEVLPSKGGDISSRSLGKFLGAAENRIESGLKIRRCGTAQRAVLWAVVSNTKVNGQPGSSEFGEFSEFGIPPYVETQTSREMCIRPDEGEQTHQTHQTHFPFECDFCGSTESRPSTKRGIPICARCSPQEAP